MLLERQKRGGSTFPTTDFFNHHLPLNMLKKLASLIYLFAGLFSISAAQVFDITQYGASSDLADNSTAIHAAAKALAEHGGGTLYVPTGVFRCGMLHFQQSDLHLHLAPGAVLQANPAAIEATYQAEKRAVFILFEECENLSISGPGTIRGTGKDTLGVSRFHPYPPASFRYDLLIISRSRGLRVRDLSLVESEMFTLHLSECTEVVIDGVIIRNNYFHPNTDAIDLDRCTNVHISNCHITAGDDGICFKNGSERVVITNCTIQTPSTAIKFGTSTEGTFRDISVSNCVIFNSMAGVGILMKDGGLVEHCSFSNLSISNIDDTLLVNQGIAHQQVPLLIDIDLRDSTSKPGIVRHISFDNIDIHSEHPVLIQGMRAQPIESLTLSNIRFHVRRGYSLDQRKKPKGFADSKFLYHDDHRLTEFVRKEVYFSLANIKGLEVSHISVQVSPEVAATYPRKVLGLYQVQEEWLEHVRLSGGESKLENLVERN